MVDLYQNAEIAKPACRTIFGIPAARIFTFEMNRVTHEENCCMPLLNTLVCALLGG